MRHGWLRVFLRDIEGNPRTQYHAHRWMARFWGANAVAAVIVYVFAPAVWSRVSVLYLVLVSLYANISTDSGAMAAANASTDERVTAYAIQEYADHDGTTDQEKR